jgi:anaerobic selenocysteine-containing dehydrogenase
VPPPLRRAGAKGEGKWEPISWETAITEITNRWKAIIAEHGAAAVDRGHAFGGSPNRCVRHETFSRFLVTATRYAVLLTIGRN